jgi:diadenosine tetraphosphate (Ap4A) HIT family hydrolase
MTRETPSAPSIRAESADPATAIPDRSEIGGFALHHRLAADTLEMGRLALSHLLLMNDATYPWLILVPERPAVREIFELQPADRLLLTEEVALVSRVLDAIFEPDKLNVAAIGNVVPQLHVHIVARFRSDPVWPAPVWGRTPPYPYTVVAAETIRGQLRERLSEALVDNR